MDDEEDASNSDEEVEVKTAADMNKGAAVPKTDAEQ